MSITLTVSLNYTPYQQPIPPNERLLAEELGTIDTARDELLKTADGLPLQHRKAYQDHVKTLANHLMASFEGLAPTIPLAELRYQVQQARAELMNSAGRFLNERGIYHSGRASVQNAMDSTATKVATSTLDFDTWVPAPAAIPSFTADPDYGYRIDQQPLYQSTAQLLKDGCAAVGKGIDKLCATNATTQRFCRAVGLSEDSGNLQTVLQERSSTANLVFSYAEPSPALQSQPTGEQTHNFAFRPYAVKTAVDIAIGNFVHCESLAYVGKAPPIQMDGLGNVDVWITGTQEKDKCADLRNAILRDAATLAAETALSRPASGKLDPKHPLSVTPVIDCDAKGCREVGDLSNLTYKTAAKIKAHNYQACNLSGMRKTRLDEGGYVRVGAIVTGNTDPKKCEDLYFANVFGITKSHKQ